MENDKQSYIIDQLEINILKQPRCKAVIDNSAANTCECMKNFLELYERMIKGKTPEEITQNETTMDIKDKMLWQKTGKDHEKIFIKTCGSGAIVLEIKRTDGIHIDPSFINANGRNIHAFINQIFDATDAYHIMEGSRDQELIYNEKTGAYELTLHRGIPKDCATNYPEIFKKKTRKLSPPKI